MRRCEHLVEPALDDRHRKELAAPQPARQLPQSSGTWRSTASTSTTCTCGPGTACCRCACRCAASPRRTPAGPFRGKASTGRPATRCAPTTSSRRANLSKPLGSGKGFPGFFWSSSDAQSIILFLLQLDSTFIRIKHEKY